MRVIEYLQRFEKPIDSKNKALKKIGKSFKHMLEYLKKI